MRTNYFMALSGLQIAPLFHPFVRARGCVWVCMLEGRGGDATLDLFRIYQNPAR